jgi:hypothetical protein
MNAMKWQMCGFVQRHLARHARSTAGAHAEQAFRFKQSKRLVKCGLDRA